MELGCLFFYIDAQIFILNDINLNSDKTKFGVIIKNGI